MTVYGKNDVTADVKVTAQEKTVTITAGQDLQHADIEAHRGDVNVAADGTAQNVKIHGPIALDDGQPPAVNEQRPDSVKVTCLGDFVESEIWANQFVDIYSQNSVINIRAATAADGATVNVATEGMVKGTEIGVDS